MIAMFFSAVQRVGWLATFLAALSARADGWSDWGSGSFQSAPGGGLDAKLASDGTNMYFSRILGGVYRASLADGVFYPMPMTGFPSWDANTNTNGFGVVSLAVTPQNTVVIGGEVVNYNSGDLSINPLAATTNTLPVFYWWDDANQLWQPASVTGHAYPYTANVGNFSVMSDGSLWACSGFYSYAYRSTDGGKSYTAMDVNSLMPTNYFPLVTDTNLTGVGQIFSICAGWNNEVVIGTETAGYFHTTNNGATWTSLDPNFTSIASTNPLGRVVGGYVAGVDHYGNFLCANHSMANCPAKTNWVDVGLIGFHPADSSFFNAANGMPPAYGPNVVVTAPSGWTYCNMSNGTNNLGGVYRSFDGKTWAQFNNNLPVVSPNVGNGRTPGDCITAAGNKIFIGGFYVYDTTPVPVTNLPPIALPQNVNTLLYTPANFTLTGTDADGDPLNFTVTVLPAHGTLSGTPPNLAYTAATPDNPLDHLTFVVDDGTATSAPVVVNFSASQTGSSLPTISLVASATQGWAVAPANVALAATVEAPNGIYAVSFYNGTNLLATQTNSPFNFTWINPPPGDFALSACVQDSQENFIWSQPVRVLVLGAAPQLSIQQTGPDVAVMWPLALDGFFVQSATNVAGPWTLSPYAPMFSTTNQTATIPMSDRQFFRIMRPH